MNNEIKILLILILISFSLLGLGYSLKKEITMKSNNYVITTSYVTYSLTKQLLNNTNIETVIILKPGINAHNYEPKLSDILLLNNASAVVFTNKYFEVWVEKLLNSNHNDELMTIDAGEKLTLICENENCEDKDPHIWLSPNYGLNMAKNIKEKLLIKFPESEKIIEKNFEKLREELKYLHSKYDTTLANCKYNKLYVYHKAFGYLEKDYQIHQISILNNYVPEGEPSFKHLESIVKEMKKENYNHVLLEKNINEKAIQFLKDNKVKVHLFDTMEVYYDNDLNLKYQDKLLSNLETLKEVLECN